MQNTKYKKLTREEKISRIYLEILHRVQEHYEITVGMTDKALFYHFVCGLAKQNALEQAAIYFNILADEEDYSKYLKEENSDYILEYIEYSNKRYIIITKKDE